MLETLKKLRQDHEDGFTLIELLVVMLIIGILSAIAVPVFLNQRKVTNDAVVEADVKNAILAVETYAVGADNVDAPIPTDKLGLQTSEGSHVDVTGTLSGGYCVQGYHDNGKKYTSEHMRVFLSNEGGYKIAPSCADTGVGGEIDITPGGGEGQTVEFTDNGDQFAVSLRAMVSHDGGIDLLGSYTEPRTKSFRATFLEVQCKDSSIKGLPAPRNMGINFSGTSFATGITKNMLASGCEPVSLTINPLGVSTVASQTTVTVENKDVWQGEKKGSGKVDIVFPELNSTETTSVETTLRITAKNGSVEWQIDPVSLPAHVTKLTNYLIVVCDDGRRVEFLSDKLSGTGSKAIGSCVPNSVLVPYSANYDKATASMRGSNIDLK